MEEIENKSADEAIFKSKGQLVKIKYKMDTSPGSSAG